MSAAQTAAKIAVTWICLSAVLIAVFSHLARRTPTPPTAHGSHDQVGDE